VVELERGRAVRMAYVRLRMFTYACQGKSLSETIREKLIALRASRGLTQRALAAAIGVTETTIRNYEHGRHSLDATHQIAIGKLAGPPDCWFWWGLAGLTKKDVFEALGLPSFTDTEARIKTSKEAGKKLYERTRKQRREVERRRA